MLPSDNALFELGAPGSASGDLEYRRDRDHAGAWVYGAGPPPPANGFWLQDNPAMGGTDPWVIGVAASPFPSRRASCFLALASRDGLVVRGSNLAVNREFNEVKPRTSALLRFAAGESNPEHTPSIGVRKKVVKGPGRLG